MGSVAFGALVLAIVEIIKLFMDYLHAKLKPAVGSGAANFCLSCLNCCLDCFERFIRFLNRHAYIQIAMTGENFCKAAEEAFFLICRYVVSLGLVHGIGEVFVWFGTLFITVGSTLIGWLILTHTSLHTKIYSPMAPTVLFVIISYVIGSNFMSVYGMSADTIIHCYCMDDELHESQGGAQHAPELLRDFIQEHQKKNPMAQKLVDQA